MTDTAKTVPATASNPNPPALAAEARTSRSNRNFMLSMWRILVGVKDGLVLVFMLLFFAMLFIILTARPNAAAVSEGALVLDIDGVISEQPAEVDPFASLSGPTITQYRARDLIRAIDAAAKDDEVKAIVLDLDGFMGGGQVTLARIGESIAAARKADKPVLAFATAYSDDAYTLAANASEIWVHPMGGVAIAGPGGSRLYYRGLMDRLGVKANIYRVGTFKSAVEPFLRNDQSPEAREMNQAYADALWEQWQQHVTAARPSARVADYAQDPAAMIDAAEGDLARASVTAGLVDKTGTRLAFQRRVAELAGAGEDEDRPDDFAKIDLDDYLADNPLEESGDQIAIVPVVGAIVDGEAGPGTAGGTTIAENIYDAIADGDAKAIVLRVDSGGGSALASEEIRQALMAAREKDMPVVVSMANVAASGGYWVAGSSDRIFAEPDTITGSIGVFGLLPTFEGSLDKIGVGADGVKTTPLSGQPDIFGGTSEQFDRVVQSGVEDIYSRFLTLVSETRKLPRERVAEIAEGRVWAGGTARQLGLVDTFGGLDEAVAEAAKLAKLDADDVYVRYYEPQPDEFAQMIADILGGDSEAAQARGGGIVALFASQRDLDFAGAIADVERLVASNGSIQAECLECSAYAGSKVTSSPTRGFWAMLRSLFVG